MVICFFYRETWENDLFAQVQEQATPRRKEEKGGATPRHLPGVPDAEGAGGEPEPAGRPVRRPEEEQGKPEAEEGQRQRNERLKCELIVNV